VRVAVFTRYPQQVDRPHGGVEAVAVVLIRALARLDDLEVHVVTLESGRSTTEVTQDGQVTIHRLPGSRWPQIIDILAGPGRKRLVLTGLASGICPSHTYSPFTALTTRTLLRTRQDWPGCGPRFGDSSNGTVCQGRKASSPSPRTCGG
jgi:hypothetical protein